MKKLLIVVLVAAVLAGVGFGGYRNYIASMRSPILGMLKDPDSAIFRNENMANGFLCGEVNAKNSMGGYVGFKKFVAYKQGYALEDASTMEFNPDQSSIDHKKKLIHDITRELYTKAVSGVINGASLTEPSNSEIINTLTQREFPDIWGHYCSG